MDAKDSTFAIFRDKNEIRTAARSFRDAGFENSSIKVFQSNRLGSQDFSQTERYQGKKGAIFGGLLGIILVSGFSLLTWGSLATGSFVIHLLRILMGGLIGAGAGALIGFGMPRRAAMRYGKYLQMGGILLSVHSNDSKQAQLAAEILSLTGGQDIQRINENRTWNTANLERAGLELLQMEEDAVVTE